MRGDKPASGEALTVEFCGDRAGEAPMTWGQRAIWTAIQWLEGEDHYFNVPCVLPVPPGQSFATVTQALSVLGARHQTLRTTYPVTPDGPRQAVAARCVLTVPVVRPDGADARQVADRTLRNLAATSFGVSELPWRCALVADDATPLFLVLVFNHQAVDGWALRLISAQLTALLAGTRADEGPASPRCWQPLEQVEYEARGEGAQRGQLSLRYWRARLSEVPRSMFDFPRRQPADQRFWQLGMDSPATAVAADQIATRLNVSTSAVLLAASAAALTDYNGHHTCVMQLIVANRFDAARRSLVAAMAQDGLFVVSRDVPDFDDLVSATYRSALSAYRYGYYPPVELADLRRDIGVARGGPVDLSAFFNDARFGDRWEALPPVPSNAAQWSALRGKTRVSVTGSWERQDAKLFVSIAHAPDTCLLKILSDTAYISADGVRTLLHGIESVLVAAAQDTVRMADLPAVSGVQAVTRGPDWTFVDGCWVDVTAVRPS